MRELGGIDGAFLYCETDTMPMTVAGLVVLDTSTMRAGYSRALLRTMVAERLPKISLLRRKLVTSPMHIGRPYWAEDPQFDPGRHLRFTTLDGGGTDDELADVASRTMERRLPRDRPLWELTVIEGLRDSRIALLFKLHHSVVDGVSATTVFGRLFDLEPIHEFTPLTELRQEVEPSWARMLWRGVLDRSREPVEILKVTAQTLRGFSTAVIKDASGGNRTPELASPLSTPRTSLNGRLTARRSIGMSHVPINDVRKAKDALGVKINDVLTASVGGALRRYLTLAGELPERSLVAAEPVSIHDDANMHPGNTKLSVMFAYLGTNITDPVERVRYIARGNERAKQIQHTVGNDVFLSWSEHFWLNALSIGLRVYSRLQLADRIPVVYNLILSNVPGPTLELFVAGAAVEGIHMLGPLLDGAGLNVTALSHDDKVSFGVIACPDLVEDVGTLATEIPIAFEEILERA